MMRAFLTAGLLAGLVAPALATPVATLPVFPAVYVDNTVSMNGRVFTQTDRTALVSGVELFVVAGLDRQPSGQSGVAALTAQAILQTPVQVQDQRLPLVDAARALGGSIEADVEGQSVRFYLEARDVHVEELTRLFAQALSAPAFDAASVQAARAELLRRIAQSNASPLQAGIADFRDAFYRTSNAGLPPLGTTADMQKLTPGMLKAFFLSAYHRSGASAVVVGDVTPEVQSQARALVDSLTPGTSSVAHITAKPALSSQTSIISYRNTQSPWFVLGYGAPPADSPDFGAMMVLATVLQTQLTRDSITTVPIPERPVGLRYDYQSDPATFLIYIDGGAVDPASIEREILLMLSALGSTKLDAHFVDGLKTMTEGRFVTDTASVSTRAEQIGALANLGLGADGVNHALRQIDAVTPADLQRVIKHYCGSPMMSVILPHDNDNR